MASSATGRDVVNREESVSNGNGALRDQQSQPNGYQQDTSLTADPEDKTTKEKKPSALKKLWTKIDLDIPTVMMMCKAALPPTIALAIFQADRVAQHYTTLGYLIAIMSILSFCIMPRAKFLQTMVMNVFSVSFAAAFAMLMLWSSVKAREHTTPHGARPQRYNSSQSAVLAVWLFFQIYFVNTIKARFPQLAFPVIVYSIFVNVAATNGFLFITTPQAEAFVWKLLHTFWTGFAIGTGVSLFIIPVTCRKVLMKEVTGYVGLLRGALGAHKTYIHSLEGKDMFGKTYLPEPKENAKKKGKENKPKTKPEIEAIQNMVNALQALHGKVAADLPFAKREIAYGKLTPDNLETLFKHLRALFLPITGLASVIDLFERAGEVNHWNGEDVDHNSERHKHAVKEWNEVFQYLHEPFDKIFQSLDDGLHHASLKLGLAKAPKKKKGKNQDDTEAKGDAVSPGDEGFAEHFEKQANEFFNMKTPTLRYWMESKGIKLQEDYSTKPEDLDENTLSRMPTITTESRERKQLYTLLYIMFLLNSINRATLEFIKFADSHDQAKLKSKFIWPGARRFKKWVKSIFDTPDANQEDEITIAGSDRNRSKVYMGEAFKHRKDPEHLPPTNAWEKFGNMIRSCSHFLGSSESAFGFRAACATMSIAIVAYLRVSQTFFVEQRLVWALIMVAISMTPTSGQAMYQFVLRITGTALAMVLAFLMWYIPDQHTAGVLVFIFVFTALGFYIPLKRFDLVIAGVISVVTATLIVGYELQVRKLGVKASTQTGQPAYPIYELGPYRLATVVGGLAVAFFWTVFPYPITEHSALRQKLGGALYLSANFYSIMHEQVMSRMRGDAGDEENDKNSPGHALLKARNKVIQKLILSIQGLKQHAGFVRWEFPLGGKFPVDEYSKIIGLIEK